MSTGDDDLFRPEGEQPREKQSSGCGLRFVLIMLAVAGGMTMLCCCGIGISLYSMAPTFENNPVTAKANLDELIDIELPETYKPEAAINMDVFSFVKVRGSFMEIDDNGGVLIVAGLSGQLAQNQDFFDKISEEIKKEANDSEMEVLSTEVKEFEIGGKPVEFTFLHGRVKAEEGMAEVIEDEIVVENENIENIEVIAPEEGMVPAEEGTEVAVPAEENEEAQPASKKREVRQVRAILPGKGGSKVFFLLIVEEKKWNEEEVVKMIESIKVPEQ